MTMYLILKPQKDNADLLEAVVPDPMAFEDMLDLVAAYRDNGVDTSVWKIAEVQQGE